MDRTHAPGATPSHMFTEGDPGLGVPATTVSAVHMNALQEELVGIIEAAGLTPSEANNGQVLEALRLLLPSTTVQNTGGAFTTTSGSPQVVASLSLVAGQWLIQGDALLTAVSGTLSAAGIETNVGGSAPGERNAMVGVAIAAGAGVTVNRGPRIVTLATTTTVNLTVSCFTTGSASIHGWLTATRLGPAV